MYERNGGSIRAGDATIRYQIYGSGPPLVLLHGNHQSSAIFHGYIDKLCEICQVITIDSRGHGRSTLGSERLTFSVLAKDVIRVLDELGIEKTAVLGFSDGGNIAQQMAVSDPQRLFGVILASSNLTPAGMKLWFRVPIHIAHRFWLFLERIHIMPKRFRRERELSRLMAEQPNLSAEDLSSVRLPTLVMAGEHDIVSRDHTMEIAASVKGAQVAIIRGSGHSALFQKPEECSRIIQEFLLDLIHSRQRDV